MIGFATGAMFALALNYSLGREVAPTLWEDRRSEWWGVFTFVSLPLAGLFGALGWIVEAKLT